MQAIDYVIRDDAGRTSRGEIGGNADQLVLSVDQLSHVSLNLSRDDVDSYRRIDDQLIIRLEDGREIVLDGMFEGEEAFGTRLYFSEHGEIHEITFSEAWGRTNYAHFDAADGVGDLVFSDAASVAVTQPEVTMAAVPLFVGGGLGGAGLIAGGVAGAAVIGGVGGGGGGASGPDPFLASNGGQITSNGTGSDGIANADEIANGLTIVGYTYPNTLVTVTIGTATLTTTSDANGNYTVAFDPADIVGGTNTSSVSATITDSDGNVLTATSDFSVDTDNAVSFNANTVEGDGLILASETADGILVTGSAEANANVVVTFNGQTLAATANGTGGWSVNFPGATAAGFNDQMVPITAEATDLAGNVISVTHNVQVDTVLDVSINPMQVGDDVINRDEAASGVTFTGTTNPGAFVSVIFNGVTEDATVDANGMWTVDFASAAIPGSNSTLSIQANASDALGNATSTSHSVYIDQEGMVAINAAPVEIDDIVNLNEQADGLTLTGTTTPGSVVVVHFHSFTGNATVFANGQWTVDIPASDIDLGQYDVTVTATATTPNGNVSVASDMVRIDTYVDELTHNGLVAGDSFINAQEQSDGVVLSGTVEPGSIVTVEMDNTTKPATVDSNGDWSVTFTSADVDTGEYQTTMTATAVDVAGNTHTISQAVQVDTVANSVSISSVPIEGDNTVNATEASDGVELTGQGDPGVTVSVTVGGVTHTTIIDDNGEWTVFFTAPEINSNDGVTPVVVQTSDTAGNVTTVNSSLTIDTEVSNVQFPTSPIGGDGVINGAEAADGVVVTGTGEVGATVVVAIGNQNISTVVDGNGEWNVTLTTGMIPAGEQNVDVVATITDTAGNTVSVTQAIQVDTVMTNFAVTSTSMQTEAVINGDGVAVLNAFAAQNGIDLNGTVEQGSTVMVTFGDTTKAATVNGTQWSITFSGDEVPAVETVVSSVIVATDPAGNTSQAGANFTLDTSIPDAPSILSVTIGNVDKNIEAVSIADDGNNYDFAVLNADDTVTLVNPYVTTVPNSGEYDYNFYPELDPGSDLLVTLNDDSGNQSSTLFVSSNPLDPTDNPIVDLGSAGLDDYQIEAIDLNQANEATLEITLDQLEGLSDLTDSLLIRGHEDDSVIALGAEDTLQDQTIGDQTYDIYTMGTEGAILLIDQEIDVTT